MKKSLAIILALVLAISLLAPAAAFAAETDTYRVVFELEGPNSQDITKNKQFPYNYQSGDLKSLFGTLANGVVAWTQREDFEFARTGLKDKFDEFKTAALGDDDNAWTTALDEVAFSMEGAMSEAVFQVLNDRTKTVYDLAQLSPVTIKYKTAAEKIYTLTITLTVDTWNDDGGEGSGSETKEEDADIKVEVPEGTTEMTVDTEVKPAESTEDAETIEIDIPDGATVEVTIPVDSDSSRVVVYKVNPDGSKEIMPIVAKTEDGVKLKLDDDVKIQIVEKTDDNGVDQDAWYAEAMNNVYDNELDEDIPAAEMVPEEDCSRGTFTTLLYNMYGKQAAVGAGFQDTDSNDYYDDASTWGKAIGLIKGEVQEDGTIVFNGDGNLERQQMATFLWRLAGGPKVTPMSGVTTDETCEDYVNAMSWCISVGLIQGDEGGYRPGDPASVAEAAQMILNFVNLGLAGTSN